MRWMPADGSSSFENIITFLCGLTTIPPSLIWRVCGHAQMDFIANGPDPFVNQRFWSQCFICSAFWRAVCVTGSDAHNHDHNPVRFFRRLRRRTRITCKSGPVYVKAIMEDVQILWNVYSLIIWTKPYRKFKLCFSSSLQSCCSHSCTILAPGLWIHVRNSEGSSQGVLISKWFKSAPAFRSKLSVTHWTHCFLNVCKLLLIKV